TAPFTNQWVKNSSIYLTDTGNITGSGTTSLTVHSVSYLDAGTYAMIATNGNGNSVTSSVATLTVKDPFITSQPTSLIKVAGDTANFTVGASGSSLTYIWKKGSTVLA